MIEIRSASPSETLALGRRLAGLLKAGDVVLLSGKLGAGKTLLAAGVGEGLGVQERMTSPSFLLSKTYDGFLPVVHADVYRLGSMSELEELELTTAASEGVLLVEWGNVVAGAMPDDHLAVEIVVEAEDERLVRFSPRGSWAGRRLEELKE